MKKYGYNSSHCRMMFPFSFFILPFTLYFSTQIIILMQLIQQILFAIVSIIAVFLFARKARELRRNILLGRDADYSDNKGLRWKNVLLLAIL